MENPTWDFDALGGTATTAAESLANPQATNALVQQAMTASVADAPKPPEAAPDHTELPGGLYWDGELIRHAQVRELTGEDEEALSRVKGSTAHWMSLLLERNVTRLGDHKPTPAMVRKLLIGDRDELLLAVRIATFGPTITAHNVQCPHCEEHFDATVDLTTVDRIRITEPNPRHEYDVPLRQGIARVRLPDGQTQEAMFRSEEATLPERNTALLGSCLIHVGNGADVRLAAKGEALARKLGLADRQKIIQFIADTQPGPQLDAISFEHAGCGREVRLPITLPELFRGE